MAVAAPGALTTRRPTSPSRARWGGTAAALRRVLLGGVGVALAVAAWEIAHRAELVSPTALPGPGAVAGGVGELLGEPLLWEAARTTTATWLTSLGLSIAVAVPLGLLIGSLPWLERPVGVLVDAARSVPSTALIPVAILIWGLGSEMKAALVIYAVFWPLLLNATYGAQGVDPMMKTVARSLHWGSVTTLRRVVLPAAAPAIATGIRVAAAVGLIVVLSAELLGATSGVGTLILRYQDINRPEMVYGAVVLVGLFGLLVSTLLTWIEARLLPWSAASRRGS